MASAMVAAWISKGSVMPWRASALQMRSGTPRWAKVVDMDLLARAPASGSVGSRRLGAFDEVGILWGWFTLTGRTNARLRTHRLDDPTGAGD